MSDEALEQLSPVEKPDLDQDQQDQSSGGWLIPFAFAKRHSVLVTTDEESGAYILHCLQSVDFDILLEIRRLLKAPFSLDYQEAAAFELLLTQAYQRDSSEAQQMMENIPCTLR
eukprot:TRINITY_DN1492_c0_g1_i2.p1 TRINITY_DN1492_c0_g1~~TRINITY_DN1492_c0_g1_i2.p1  ORF type:complete len:114 (+),score=24.74 TRINITY_DN1492_c0_g1_i2:151-492(+)